MTESTQPEGPRESPGPDVVPAVRDEIFPFDPTLENLVMLVNLMDTAEVGVTLHVNGAVVSGMLISARRFFKVLIGEIEAGIESNPDAEKTVRGFAEFYRPTLASFEKARDEYNESDVLPPRPHHLHMRHVLTYVSTGAEPITQTLWRGRLTEIDGWSMGNLGGRAPELPKELW